MFADGEHRSISHSHTFENDTRDFAALASMLSRLCQKAAKRLRESGLEARTVTVTIRYAGFETITRAKTLSEPAHVDPVFLAIVRRLFERHWNSRRAVRLVGVELGDLSHSAQLNLLEGARRQKLDRLARATDELRERFGFGKVQFGGSLGSGPEH